MKAMDVMVRDVVTVKPEADVASAIKLLVEHDISALPVVDDDGEVVGVISEADLVRRTEIGTEKHRPWWLEALTPGSTLAGEFAKAHGLRVSEIMSSDVISTSEETPLGEIATLLERHRIKRVPMIRDGKLVGIVSRSNLIQALASAAQGQAGAGGRSQDPAGIAVSAWGAALDRLRRAQHHRERRRRPSVGARGLPGGAKCARGSRRGGARAWSRVSDEMIPSYG